MLARRIAATLVHHRTLGASVCTRHYGSTSLTSEQEREVRERLTKAWETVTDTVTTYPVRALNATLGFGLESLKEGDRLPEGYHQYYCLPTVPTQDLGPEGFEATFMPGAPFNARMWGGSRTFFFNPLHIGDTVTRKSHVSNMRFTKAKSGPLVVLDIQNDYYRHAQGQQQLAVTDTVSLLYRALPPDPTPKPPTPLASPTGMHLGDRTFNTNVSRRPVKLHNPLDKDQHINAQRIVRQVIGSPVLLFRYSALTFNSHLIHYDPFFAAEKGFNHGILVHGPLLAAWLLDMAQMRVAGKMLSLSSFEYKALNPVYCGEPIELQAMVTSSPEGLSPGTTIPLQAVHMPSGRQLMTAQAVLA
eukprot:comp12152_c0_seq1/m.6903 comp12152_c0_seq1/g.6903  ORF comp12152_c0_seq1/g.6903 comp12152_c0_seq1/m.6903 type:complete len:359 (-) comp12152_c0_seq1:580-1656(-)